MVFESIGHAGLIGSHTALRLKQPGNNLQYSITLNERSQGGFRDTLYAMLTSHCETAPYVVMRTLRQAHNTLQELINSLRAANNCAGVYLIVSANGQSIVVEKDRGKGAGLVYPDTQVAMLDEGVLRYTVKTNYDLKEPDEDGRMGAATAKLRQAIVEKGLITQDDVWQILEEAPNFNNLTLMTAILDTISGKSRVCIWETE